jgi:hypothetical protein
MCYPRFETTQRPNCRIRGRSWALLPVVGPHVAPSVQFVSSKQDVARAERALQVVHRQSGELGSQGVSDETNESVSCTSHSMPPLFVAAECHNTGATAPFAFASCACQLIVRNAVGGNILRSANGDALVSIELPPARIVQVTLIFR